MLRDVQQWLDPARWNVSALRDQWRAAQPFPHMIVDALLPPAKLAELLEAFGEEPCERIHDEIFEVSASAIDLDHPTLRAFRDDLGGPEVRRALQAITGKSAGRIEMRGYAYEAGDYLLPHSDHQRGVGRLLAYAFYLDTPFPVEGGELELFACTFEGDEIVATEVVTTIAPAPNRLVIFDVGDVSLHQVREVTRGSRFSLSGWFYP